jgi:uncharacterized DUF497 family protein
MNFEYDPAKSESNKAKHGIDFEEAQQLWDNNVLEIRLDYGGEERFAAVGLLRGVHWTAIITYRGNAVRLISCRRSHKQESALYDKYTKNI